MKIAILGGGVGAMTAAYWLTNPLPDGSAPGHDITVYQLGWRLGGKGASGRNAAIGQRIEEHGLHIWMGFYANAFRMMRTVYGELNRPLDAPLATWEDAFKPQTVYAMADKGPDGQWLAKEWIVPTPLRPGKPGDQTGFPTPCGYIPSLTHWAADRIDEFLGGFRHTTCKPHELSETHRTHLNLIHSSLREAASHAGPPHEAGKPVPKTHTQHHPILKLALEGVQKLIGLGLDFTDSCLGMHRALIVADIAVSIGLGILRDLCDTDDWTAIDDQDWQQWMIRNGLHPKSVWSSPIRALYDIAFGYHDGEAKPEKADMAAGTTTCATARILFDYYGGLFMKMQAGMGDTIFAPIYQVLKQRGVKFKFFHRLRDVVPSDDGTKIDALQIGIQAELTETDAEYQPLIDVGNLPCWPSEPFWNQLKNGAELQASGIDFESYASPDVGTRVLERGIDFDHVVFGLSLGAVPHVCPKLLQQKQPWRDMVEKVKVVRTQAFQLWLSRNIADLGWPPALDGRNYGERAVFGTYVEPLDTWADMSQLIPRETWSVPVQNVAYFCGVMPDSEEGGAAAVQAHAHEYLDRDIGLVWTTSQRNGKFRYEWLAVNDASRSWSDEERFEQQYFRANTEPTELYVLSVAGSTKYRLDPADNGYENLSLAGDWVRNGFAIGCVESGVLGGMKGVQRFCPGMTIVE